MLLAQLMCIKIISYNVLVRTDLVISSVGNMSDIIIHTFFQIQTTSIAEDEKFWSMWIHLDWGCFNWRIWFPFESFLFFRFLVIFNYVTKRCNSSLWNQRSGDLVEKKCRRMSNVYIWKACPKPYHFVRASFVLKSSLIEVETG